MKYLNTYKLFESDEFISNEEVAELIEECKDIVETFNESEDAFKVANYETGFVKYDTHLGRTIPGRFEPRQSHESDMTAIKFNLGLSSDLNSSGSHFKDDEENITPEKIDELIELLRKSKMLVQRLSRYCSTIYYKLNGKSIKFMLIFKNPDESSSKTAKVKRLFDRLSKDFRDYDRWKTMNLAQSGEDRFPQKYRKLYDLIKTNPNLIDGRYQWDESRRSNLQLRFATSETIDGDTIIVNVSGFKYKTYIMDRFKAIKLSNEEKVESMKCIEQKIKNSLRSDADSIETSIVGNQIKIKVK